MDALTSQGCARIVRVGIFANCTGYRQWQVNHVRKWSFLQRQGLVLHSRQLKRGCWATTGGELSKEKKYEILEMGEEAQRGAHYVNWFREAWPYIQGHRGSTFVLVIPGEVIEKRRMMDCILQVLFSCQGFGDPKP
jgi:hypothetical protein